MNFFPKLSKKSKKTTPPPDDGDDHERTREDSSPRQSPSPKKSSSSSSRTNRRDSRDERRHSHTTSHNSGSRGPTPVSRAHTFDTNTHPLNLPPDLRRLSALSNMAEQMRSDPMEVDTDVHAQPSSPPAEKIPGAFNSAPNGVNGTTDKDKDSMDVDSGAPTPPPHKSPPTSPVAAAPPTPEEAEAFKNAGNKHYKAKEYRKAIEEYTKGTFIQRTHTGNVILTIL